MVFQIDYKEVTFKSENVAGEFVKELSRYGSVLEAETKMDKHYRTSGTVFLAFGGTDYMNVFDSLKEKFGNDIVFRAVRITEYYSNGYEKEEEWISNYITGTIC